jgi:hypothetical protein
MPSRATFVRSLQGLMDSRGSRGIAARGKNVYGGTRMAPKSTTLTTTNPALKESIGRRLAGSVNYNKMAKRDMNKKAALRNTIGPQANLRNASAISRRLSRS